MKILFWNFNFKGKIILFDKIKWCRFNHSAYGTKDGKWRCPKCNLVYEKRLSDNDLGPM